MEETKRCTECGHTKALRDFYKRGDGAKYRSRCKECMRAQFRAARVQDPAKRTATEARYREANPDQVAHSKREYRDRNRKIINERQALYRLANRDACNERSRDWAERNPDACRQRGHRYRARKASSMVEPFTSRDLRHDWEDHDLYACFFCGGTLVDGYEVEHFYALSKDGPHALFNLVPSCMPCNRGVGGKGTKEPWGYLREALAEQGTDLDACLAGLEAIAARRRP